MKIVINQQELFDFIPLLVLTALKNQDMIDDESPAVDLYADIEKKVLPKLRQYFRAVNSELRRKLKFLLKGIESGNNTVLTIKGSKTSNESYLTDNWKPIVETAKKYLR